MGTIRSFLDLPVTTITGLSLLIEDKGKETNSDTLNPEEYKSSAIAVPLIPFGVLSCLEQLKSSLISFSVRYLGNALFLKEILIVDVGS